MLVCQLPVAGTDLPEGEDRRHMVVLCCHAADTTRRTPNGLVIPLLARRQRLPPRICDPFATGSVVSPTIEECCTVQRTQEDAT